ncbi:MAG: hypothetical protein IKF09_09285 [Clostridiales bacterium]|nr:hypothetical protein [Clostridiales bacterium]
MRRQIALILTATFAVTMFAGCNKETLVEETTLPSDPTVTETSSDGPAYELPSFDEFYGPQIQNYLDHQYYFDGEAIPKFVWDFYVIDEFGKLSSSTEAYYGYYPLTTLGYIDLAAECPLGSDFATYGDFFVSKVEYSLESDLIKIARAKEENFVMSDEMNQSIDAIMEGISSDASSYNMSFDEYIQHYYGTSATEETFRQYIEDYYLLAYDYSRSYYDNYAAERKGNTVPYVRYALFYAPDTSDQAQKDMALECANALKDTSTSLDNFTELSEEAYGMGTVYDYGDIAVFKRDEVPSEFAVVPEFEEWAYGADRTENEIDIIYAPKYGYFVVGYLGSKEPDADEYQQMASLELENSVKDEINSDAHDLHTDDEYLPSPAAPTATPIPTATPTPAQDSTLPSLSTDMSGTGTATAPSGQKVDSVTVLIIVFITLACVAVLAVIVILIVYAMNNYKKETAIKEEIAKSKRKASVEEDDDDEDDKDDDDDEDDDESDSEDGDETDKDEESEESEEAEESDEEDEDPDVSEDSEEDDE